MWQGVQELTGYKSKDSLADEGGASLAEDLNAFFARFEVTSAATPAEALPPPPPPLPVKALPPSPPSPSSVQRNVVVSVEKEEMRKVLKGINPRKATGPDGVAGRVLRDCADQLAGVFTGILNRSLAQAIVPSCLKSSTIVPIAKKSNPEDLNDFRPVALTPIIMKCFEKLVRNYVIACLPEGLDTFQFAYKTKRSTEDAVAIVLHAVLAHLEQRGGYARLLFLDFSSAFNTILPQRLMSKLEDLGLPLSLCGWILDFLSDRPQRVRLGPYTSSMLRTNTGTPQGCVLSPLLYILYTYDCVAAHPSNRVVKFADDTTVIGLISEREGETDYRDEVERLTEWCRANNLLINTRKTKELVVDFRRQKSNVQPLLIDGVCVERVTTFRFLGIELQEDLSWSVNTRGLVKKAQQRLYFLRILRKNHLPQKLLLAFYHCAIESVLTYGLCVWYGSCTTQDRMGLCRVVKAAESIVGCPLSTLEQIYATRCHRKALDIVKDPSHPGHCLFELLPSGRRYRTMKTRTSRLKNSFFSRAISALNGKPGL